MLAIVGLIVIGPDKLPTLAKDAARLARALRDMATGAQSTLRKELADLGPEFAELNLENLRSLNPRTALTRMIFDDPQETQQLTSMPPDAPADPVASPRPGQRPLGRGEAVPFDADAT